LALREKKIGEFAKVTIGKANVAIEESAGEAFVQTSVAPLVRSFAMERAELPSAICQELLFLFARLMCNTEKC